MTGAQDSGSPGTQGPLGQEAVRLIDALQGWLGNRTNKGGTDETWARATAEPYGSTGESPECAVCPLCRSMRFLRTMKPETVEPLVGAAGALAAALQEMLRQAEAARATRPDPPPDVDTWD